MSNLFLCWYYNNYYTNKVYRFKQERKYKSDVIEEVGAVVMVVIVVVVVIIIII